LNIFQIKTKKKINRKETKTKKRNRKEKGKKRKKNEKKQKTKINSKWANQAGPYRSRGVHGNHRALATYCNCSYFVFVSEGASIGTDERPMGHGSGRPVLGTSYARTAGARRGCSGHGGGGGLSSVTHHRRPAPPPLDEANRTMVDWSRRPSPTARANQPPPSTATGIPPAEIDGRRAGMSASAVPSPPAKDQARPRARSRRLR
jgi:hypothetical protein